MAPVGAKATSRGQPRPEAHGVGEPASPKNSDAKIPKRHAQVSLKEAALPGHRLRKKGDRPRAREHSRDRPSQWPRTQRAVVPNRRPAIGSDARPAACRPLATAKTRRSSRPRQKARSVAATPETTLTTTGWPILSFGFSRFEVYPLTQKYGSRQSLPLLWSLIKIKCGSIASAQAQRTDTTTLQHKRVVDHKGRAGFLF